jgi:hypothetical protein
MALTNIPLAAGRSAVMGEVIRLGRDRDDLGRVVEIGRERGHSVIRRRHDSIALEYVPGRVVVGVTRLTPAEAVVHWLEESLNGESLLQLIRGY